ncbi:MAG: protoporphyrinogen oxidase [Oscillospiraceae bacterium]|nr:protoporphyrinogen oxidase [Oscillospiraceae bacterium]
MSVGGVNVEAKVDYRTSAQVAKVFRMTSKNVQRLTSDGVLETVETPKGRRYNWDKTVEMYVAYLSDKANGREKKEMTAELEESKLRAEVDIKEAKAEAAKIELKELQGKMHRAEDVEAITTDHVLFLRSMLMAMPGKLAVDLAGTHTAPEQAERVKREVYYILERLAEYRYDPEQYKARVRERQGWNERNGDDD